MLSVFCCYHVEMDAWRAETVREALGSGPLRVSGFFDAQAWRETPAGLDRATQRLLDWHLYATDVTLVLVSRATAGLRYVQYAVQQSLARGNRLVGVHVHRIPDERGAQAERGLTPFVPPGTPFPAFIWDTSLPWSNPGRRLLRELNAAGHRATEDRVRNATAGVVDEKRPPRVDGPALR